MAIKRLIQGKSETTKFQLLQSDAILVFDSTLENLKNTQECLYFNNFTDEEIVKLSAYGNVKNIRFIGSEKIFKTITDYKHDWEDFTKKITLNSSVEVIYYNQTGKLRIPKKTKVLIIDDSKTIQKLLTKIISSSSILEVFNVADDPIQAKKIIEEERPDLITLDIHMPHMNGVDFLKTYLGKLNIPTIMISSVSINEGPLVLEALSSGALTYIEKPTLEKMSELTPVILEQIEIVSQSTLTTKIIKKTLTASHDFLSTDGLISIGSSTGGTQALQAIFVNLPDNIPPIVVVQHIPAVFSKALAERLNDLCSFQVKEAEDGEFLKSNCVYIAPGGKQMKILQRGKEKRVEINDDDPVNRFKPSVDYLFNSLDKMNIKNHLSIILTGMGKDGSQGLLNLKNSGVMTIAQDKESSVVFGMPKVAIEIGAANKIVSLDKMHVEMTKEFNKLIKNLL